MPSGRQTTSNRSQTRSRCSRGARGHSTRTHFRASCKSMIGVIPAAGKASRMGEMCIELPKALIQIERLTLLERAVTSLKHMKVSSAVVVVGHLGTQISEFISSRNFGIEVRIVNQ